MANWRDLVIMWSIPGVPGCDVSSQSRGVVEWRSLTRHNYALMTISRIICLHLTMRDDEIANHILWDLAKAKESSTLVRESV